MEFLILQFKEFHHFTHYSGNFIKYVDYYIPTLRIGGFENLSSFESAILNFFLQKKKIVLLHSLSVNICRIARMGRNFDDYPGF